MKIERVISLINNVISNEFSHISEYEELDFTRNDIEQIELEEKCIGLFQELSEAVPKEYQALLNACDDSINDMWLNLCRFYFKKGVQAGATNLSFLKDTGMINFI